MGNAEETYFKSDTKMQDVNLKSSQPSFEIKKNMHSKMFALIKNGREMLSGRSRMCQFDPTLKPKKQVRCHSFEFHSVKHSTSHQWNMHATNISWVGIFFISKNMVVRIGMDRREIEETDT